MLHVPTLGCCRSFPSGLRSLLIFAWLLVACVSAPPAQTGPAAPAIPPVLKLDSPVACTLARATSVRFTLPEAMDRILLVVAEQQSCDVRLRLFEPKGKEHLSFDRRARGPETLFFLGVVPGAYRLEVLNVSPYAGTCLVRLAEFRDPKPDDAKRIRALAAWCQAMNHARQCRWPEALAGFQNARERFQDLGDEYEVAMLLANIAACYVDLGRRDAAEQAALEALPRFRKAADRSMEAVILHDLAGMLYFSHPDRAARYFEKAIVLAHEVNWPEQEASARALLAGLVMLQGPARFPEVRRRLEETLALLGEDGFWTERMAIHFMLGVVHQLSGAHEKAVQSRRTYERLRKKVLACGGGNDAIGLLVTLIDPTGRVRSPEEQHRIREVLPRLVQQLRRIQARFSISRVFPQLMMGPALLAYQVGAYPLARQLARDQLEQARRQHDVFLESGAHCLLGETFYKMNQPEKALSHLKAGRVLARRLGITAFDSDMLHAQALILRDQQKPDEALRLLLDALDHDASLRATLSSQRQKLGFYHRRQEHHALAMDLLMDLQKARPRGGYELEALRVYERGRARSLLEGIRESRSRIRGALPVSEALRDQEHDLRRAFDRLEARRLRLLRRSRPDTEKMAELDRRADRILEQLDEVHAAIRKTSPAFADLVRPRSLAPVEIQQLVVDEQTVLIAYALGQIRSYVCAVTPDSVIWNVLPSRDTIEKTVGRYLRLVTADPGRKKGETAEAWSGRLASVDAELETIGQELSRMLLGPVAGALRARRLAFVTEGALHYLPFCALPDPEPRPGRPDGNEALPPLVAGHEIVHLPSATTLAVLRESRSAAPSLPRAITIYADPVYLDDSRAHDPAATRGFGSGEPPRGLSGLFGPEGDAVDLARLPRLVFSRREARAISALAERNEWSVVERLGPEASRANLLADDLRSCRILHLATHGLLDNCRPALSGLVLSLEDGEGKPQNGFLRLHDVYRLRLHADLVVLGACRTARGRAYAREGLASLARGFMAAGATRVLATRWAVHDQATAQWMEHFYRRLLPEDGRSPAAALRQAQLALRADRRWNRPTYWAAFALMGDWRPFETTP